MIEVTDSRLSGSYLIAAYGEALPRVAALLISGFFFTLKPEVWPGPWVWLVIGPLLIIHVAHPLYLRTSFRLTANAATISTKIGIISTRTRTAEWAGVSAIDWKESWAFRLVGLAAAELSQTGDGSARFVIPAVRPHERRELEQLWAAGHQRAPKDAPREDAASESTLYAATIGDLVIASAVYGQFAIAGGALALAVHDLLRNLGVSAFDAAAEAAPVAVAIATSVVIVAAGVGVTVVRLHGFSARRTADGEVTIGYGLLSRQVRAIAGRSVIGVVSKRNVFEMLLGRVRVTLLSRDSASGLGANLILPSLPQHVVDRVVRDGLGVEFAGVSPSGPRGTAIARALLALTCLTAPSIALYVALREHRETVPLIDLALAAIAASVITLLGTLISARLSTAALPDAFVATASFISERRWIVQTSSAHVVSAISLRKRMCFASVHYFAGRPRTLAFVRFDPSDVQKLQHWVVARAALSAPRRSPILSEAQ